MDDLSKAIDGQPVAAVGAVVVPPTEDYEARIATLEAEKNNYKDAFLKQKAKNREVPEILEGDDDRLRQIAREELANSRLAEIATEQDTIIKKALKENKELKLAQLNRTTPPAAIGSHSESQPVKDTLITEEQMQVFKKKGWSDKDIERYKKNLLKGGGR